MIAHFRFLPDLRERVTIVDDGVGAGAGVGVYDVGAGTSVTSVCGAGCDDCAGAGVDDDGVGAGAGVDEIAVDAGDGIGVVACAGAGVVAADDGVGAGDGSAVFDDADVGVEAATCAGPSVILSAALCKICVHVRVLTLGPGSDVGSVDDDVDVLSGGVVVLSACNLSWTI